MAMKVLLWYDVEDYITEESDDALLALVNMMDGRGIRGTFKLVGEKIRALKSRGREDILEKLAGHDLGYHTDMHSEHPTISAYCDPLSFLDGALEVEKREAGGLADLRRIMNMPVSTYGQPGAAWAPQVFPVLRKWGIPTYVDSNDMIDLDHGPFWYGGILSLTLLKGIMRMELEVDGLDHAKAQFDQLADSGEELISIFYHPCEYATVEFWDSVNFSRGVNTPRENWRRSRLRAPGEMSAFVEILGQFIDYLLVQGCTFITTAQLMDDDCFGAYERASDVSPDDVHQLANMWHQDIGHVCIAGQSLCASEVFSLFRATLCREKLYPELLYGPEANCDTQDSARGTLEDYRRALRIDYPSVLGYPQLPDYFTLCGKMVNPVDMACTLAWIIRNRPDEADTIDVIRGSLKPQKYINNNPNWGEKWIIFPADFQVSRLLETARLQAWTLKPALWQAADHPFSH